MRFLVDIDKKAAIRAGSDTYGQHVVALPLAELPEHLRPMLVDLVQQDEENRGGDDIEGESEDGETLYADIDLRFGEDHGDDEEYDAVMGVMEAPTAPALSAALGRLHTAWTKRKQEELRQLELREERQKAEIEKKRQQAEAEQGKKTKLRDWALASGSADLQQMIRKNDQEWESLAREEYATAVIDAVRGPLTPVIPDDDQEYNDLETEREVTVLTRPKKSRVDQVDALALRIKNAGFNIARPEIVRARSDDQDDSVEIRLHVPVGFGEDEIRFLEFIET